MKKTIIISGIMAFFLSMAIGQSAHAFGKMDSGQSQAAQSDENLIKGKVIETMDSGGYTYAQIEQSDGKKLWLAFPKTKITKGKEMSFYPGGVMTNFASKTLNRTFDEIIFSGGPAKETSAKKKEKKETGKGKSSKTSAKAETVNEEAAKESEELSPGSKGSAVTVTEEIKVAKAEGPDAYTVGELFKNIAKLDQKSVVVKAKVVKVASGIMNKNWVHIQDGTGDSGNKDLVVTSTNDVPSVGDIVTVSGTAVKDKDFGAGYKYAVIIENGTFKK